MTRSPNYFLTKLALRPGPQQFLVHALVGRACRKEGVHFTLREGDIELRRDRRVIRISKRNLPFAIDLSRQFDESFSMVASVANGHDSVVDFSRSRIHRYTKSGLEFELVSFPEEESALEMYFRYFRPSPGDLVFDVGANCGVSTYHFAQAVGPSGKVFAFEPDPANYEVLIRNMKRHRLENVVPVKRAIAGANGTAEFHSEGTLGSGLSRYATRPSLGTVELVETVTLERACAEYGTPSFLKMDIEGAEIGVLGAAQKFLKEANINFVLDTNHIVDGKRTDAEVSRLFSASGYQTKTTDQYGFVTTWAHRGATFRELA
jgi:FkbM family methyltransferase